MNKYGFEMEIIEYVNNKDITVRFLETGSIVKCGYSPFSKGTLRSPYDKTVYGIGFLGEGKYPNILNGVNTQAYKTWHGMMRRGYDQDFKDRNPSYKEVTVCEHWHNYQNFAAWFEKNYYDIEGEKMNLDKDILTKGNKQYSPDTCIFVPAYINTLFANAETNHGKYFTCIYSTKAKENKFCVRTRTEHIGNYPTLEKAFTAYKRHKELVIRDIANLYKEKIPARLYNAMLNYKIEMKKDVIVE